MLVGHTIRLLLYHLLQLVLLLPLVWDESSPTNQPLLHGSGVPLATWNFPFAITFRRYLLAGSFDSRQFIKILFTFQGINHISHLRVVWHHTYSLYYKGLNVHSTLFYWYECLQAPRTHTRLLGQELSIANVRDYPEVLSNVQMNTVHKEQLNTVPKLLPYLCFWARAGEDLEKEEMFWDVPQERLRCIFMW